MFFQKVAACRRVASVMGAAGANTTHLVWHVCRYKYWKKNSFLTNTSRGFTKLKKHICFKNIWIVETIQNSIFHNKIWTVHYWKIPAKESVFSKDIDLKSTIFLNLISSISTFWRFQSNLKFSLYHILNFKKRYFKEQLHWLRPKMV